MSLRRNIFFHATDLAGSLRKAFEGMQVGDRVAFRRATSERGPRAVDVQPASELDGNSFDMEFGRVAILTTRLYGFLSPDGSGQ